MEPTVTKVEIFGENIEIEFSDGTKEEIENGIYERKDADGDTVEERAATAADRARLEAFAASVEGSSGVTQEFVLADGTKVETRPGKIEVTYPDGSQEEIENGIYERYNAAGVTVEERPATAADVARLEAFLPDASAPGTPTPPVAPPAGPGTGTAPATVAGTPTRQEFVLADGTKVETRPGKIEITYPDGSLEEIQNGIYERYNAAGVTVEERPATAADVARLEAFLPGGSTPGTPGSGGSGNDDGTPDQGSGDAPGTPGSGGTGDDDGTPDQGSGDGGSGDRGRATAEEARSVAYLYEAALNRTPDLGGLNFWIDRVEDGASLEELAGFFLDSIEFTGRVGDVETLTDRALVEELYENILDRPGEDEGVLFWVGVLEGGRGRAAVLVDFALSGENAGNAPEIASLVESSPGEWEFSG